MNPGPPRVVACPLCLGRVCHPTLISGNTFGARVWTDGKQEAPMLPSLPPVVRCRICRTIFWLADAPEVRTRDAGDDPIDCDRVGWIEPPSAEECLHAIAEGVARGRKRELMLRLFAWHRANDAGRHPGGAADEDSPRPPEAMYQDNLKRLIPLLTGRGESTRFLKAAALRELGRFKLAAEILETIPRRAWRDWWTS